LSLGASSLPFFSSSLASLAADVVFLSFGASSLVFFSVAGLVFAAVGFDFFS